MRASKSYPLSSYRWLVGSGKWTHIVDSELCLAVVDIHGSQIELQIILRSKVLDTIPVSELGRISSEQKAMSQAVNFHRKDLAIWTVRQREQLGVEYCSSSELPTVTQVTSLERRRVQLSFQHSADADAVFRRLVSLQIEYLDHDLARTNNQTTTSESLPTRPQVTERPPQRPSSPRKRSRSIQQATTTETKTTASLPQISARSPEMSNTASFGLPESSSAVPPERPKPAGFPTRASQTTTPANSQKTARTKAKKENTRKKDGGTTRRPRSTRAAAANPLVLNERTRLPPPDRAPITATTTFETTRVGETGTVKGGQAGPSETPHESDGAAGAGAVLGELSRNTDRQGPDMSLKCYADQAHEVRLETLRHFIRESLQDENFVKLCVDVDQALKEHGSPTAA